MIKAKIIELINRQLDGELNEEEKAQLKNYLRRNQEAQRFYNAQRHMITYLNAVPDLNPPLDMKDSIMASVAVAARPDRKNHRAAVFEIGSWLSRENMRLIISHAAFLMIGFGLSAYLFNFSPHQPVIDLTQLSGTIGLHHQGLDASKSVQTIDLQKSPGHVALAENQFQVWITFDLSSADEFKTSLSYDPASLNFNGFMASRSENISLANTNKGLVVHSKGSYLLIFNKLKNQSSEFQIEISNTSQENERLKLTVNRQ